WMLTLALLCGLPARGFADLLHYHNGATAQGKVFRITGDIIEFKTRGFGGKEYIKRLTLNNRNDIIETWGNKKYFGELIYIDKFKVEL
ncbi:hypothetical protein ACE4Z7_24855, partial [Salmonella enterica]|uniref:hypothetical protein n=1 Tax=Salmonella enterica TaxID=28901 RepID=UPI003D287CE5